MQCALPWSDGPDRHNTCCTLSSQYNNPQETYNYYYLPFCAPPGAEKAKHKWGGLGEVLEGNELIDSQLEVKFRSASRQRRPGCKALPSRMRAEPIRHS